MSTNKHALIRYKILDNCFRNTGKRYFINDLIIECDNVLLEMDSSSNGISRRQIFEDIAFMESKEGWQVELERQRDGKRVYYRYTDPSFSINNMPLSEVEINQLQSAIQILSHFKGMPQFEWINELIPKLKQGISSDQKTISIIDFDSNIYLKGIEHIGPLYNAIYNKTVLSVGYQPYETDERYSITIHPYFLKQYNNRWFLFGYNPEKEKFDWNLAIDRISSINDTSITYVDNNVIDWQEYFEDIIGVTKPSRTEVENVVLQFFGGTGKYIESKPLHGSQKSKWIDKNTLEVRLSLMINYEFERLILSYSDTVRIIRPESFSIAIKTRLKEAIKKI